MDIASEFLNDGLVLYVVDGEGRKEEWKVRRGGMAKNIPMVVLANESSASSSEILVGAWDIRWELRSTLEPWRQEGWALVYPSCISPALMIYVSPGSVVHREGDIRFMYADEFQELHGVAKKRSRATKVSIVFSS